MAWVERVVHSRAFQSREPSSVSTSDTTVLVSRLSNLAVTDPALFLERYGSLLTPEEQERHFSALGQHNYEVRWHLARLQRTAAEASQTRRNRRYRCMQELEREGDFFSDHGIQSRAPAIFHEYLGKLLPAGGLVEATERHCFTEDTPLSERLLANIDEDVRSRQVARTMPRAKIVADPRRKSMPQNQTAKKERTKKELAGAAVRRLMLRLA